MAAKKNLVIVESPAKAKTIGKYLGPDYVVKASMGHLRDLPKSTMGVDIDGDFTPQYLPVKDRADVIADLKKRAKSADTVYLATDPDREGEAISWHLKELLDLPDELLFSAFTVLAAIHVSPPVQHGRVPIADVLPLTVSNGEPWTASRQAPQRPGTAERR